MFPNAAFEKINSKPLHLKKNISHLTSTVGTRATDTGDTGDGTTSSPGLSAGLVSGLFADGVRLPFVLCDALCKPPFNSSFSGC
jgi:hypothetical protein